MSTILSGHQIKYRAHRFECLLCGARLLNLMQFNGRECPGPRAVAEPPMTAPTGTEATTARIAEVLAEHRYLAGTGRCQCGSLVAPGEAHQAHVAALLSAGVIRDMRYEILAERVRAILIP